MHVRLADLEADAPAIMAGARDFLSRIEFSDWFPTDENELAAAVARILALDGVEVALAIDSGVVVGGLGVIYAPYIWNPRIRMGEELFFWTARGAPNTAALLLLRFARRRAVETRAGIVAFKSLRTSPVKLARLYEAMGLRYLESTYMGVL